MDRLERLLNLVATLRHTDRLLQIDEIRDRVPGYPESDPAFKRAFARDKETLRDMGIPITVAYLNPGDREAGQGYRIPKERYELPDPGLEPSEVAALQLAATLVRFDGDEATEAIWKLGGVVGEPDEWNRPTVSEPGVSLGGSEHLAAMFEAVADRRAVTFGYRGEDRTVDPWRLGFRNGFWYLAGWDHERRDRRTFRLDRLTGAPQTGPPGAFPRPEGGGMDGLTAPWEMGDDQPVMVEVLVDADQAPWAAMAAGEPSVAQRYPDGAIRLVLSVTNRDGLRSFLAGLLHHAEVVGPPGERAATIRWLEEMAG